MEDMLRELRARTRLAIDDFPLPDEQGQRQQVVQRMVLTYLIYHGYCSTAQAFSRATGQPIDEDISAIENRQRVSKLVLVGRIGKAIELTRRLYPGLLERDTKLLFFLKCRQFVEMVSGSDSEVCGDKAGVASNGVATSVISHTSRTPCANGQDHPKHTNVADGCGARASVESMIAFGRELYAWSHNLQLDKYYQSMMQDAFSLLAYNNPWASPVGCQLEPSRREEVCEALNAAILESQSMQRISPVDACVSHLRQLLRRMPCAELGDGASAELSALLRR